jgi:hypothetical protein
MVADVYAASEVGMIAQISRAGLNAKRPSRIRRSLLE